jgi:uncharacterized membrane protein YkvA (DUF1232 family)
MRAGSCVASHISRKDEQKSQPCHNQEQNQARNQRVVPVGEAAMDEMWRQPFSKAEMEAMRRAQRDEEGLLAEVIARLKRLARRLPFAEDLLAAYHCVRDPATSTRVKLILLAALAYFVMPVDAVSDFVPLLGFTDDAAVLAAAIASVRDAIRPEHREQARANLSEYGLE